MTRALRLIALGGVLLTATTSVSSQHIFRPWIGERAVEMVRDIDKRYDISKMGAPCGEYFLYEELGDQQVVTLKVPVTKQEERQATTSLVRIDRRLIDVELDDAKWVPTAEWQDGDGAAGGVPRRLVIRIARRDFEAAACLLR
jgi:hypothetical protein